MLEEISVGKKQIVAHVKEVDLKIICVLLYTGENPV